MRAQTDTCRPCSIDSCDQCHETSIRKEETKLSHYSQKMQLSTSRQVMASLQAFIIYQPCNLAVGRGEIRVVVV
jgi:hypothetical protein